MGDSRLGDVSNFITKKHHETIPENLRPEGQPLSKALTVCVVGAGKGIGEHIAYAYARAGAKQLLIAARSGRDLEAVARNIKAINEHVQVEYRVCDVSKAAPVAELADFIKAQFGRLDILVHNPGYAGPVTLKIHEGQPEWVQQAFDVNAMGTYNVAHYLIPILLASSRPSDDHDSKITKSFFVIGSFASLIRRGTIANTGYCVSKMAQLRLVEMVHEQYHHDRGLVALTIHPGAVATDMAAGNTPEDFLPYLIDNVGLCGAVCVWLSAHIQDMAWLSGRLISANWDVHELASRKEEVVEKDLLKLALVIG